MRPIIAGLALLGAAATITPPAALAQTRTGPGATGTTTPGATTATPPAATTPNGNANGNAAAVAPNDDTRRTGAARPESSSGTEASRTLEPGANSFTEGQARSRIESAGYAEVTGLSKDDQGIWRGHAMRNGQPVDVALDFRGNVIAGPGASASGTGTTGTGATGAPAPMPTPSAGTAGGGTGGTTAPPASGSTPR